MNNYTENHSGYKNSCEKYRTIAGIKYEQWVFNENEIDENLGLKCRIINGELFREVTQTTINLIDLGGQQKWLT